METTVIWALLTGLITGGVWVGIVFHQRQRRLGEEHESLRRELHRRMDALEAVDTQLAELEERLDFAERLLRTEDTPPRLKRPER